MWRILLKEQTAAIDRAIEARLYSARWSGRAPENQNEIKVSNMRDTRPHQAVGLLSD
jgi:hypothetical protein